MKWLPPIFLTVLFWVWSTSALPIISRGKGKSTNEFTALAATAATSRFTTLVSTAQIAKKIFEEADSNHNGRVDFEEVYELVLKAYVHINRSAPITPPSKKRVLQLFLNADVTHDGQLDRHEFKTLVDVLAQRAISRVIAHKIVTLVAAPVLATYIVRALKGYTWLPKVAAILVPSVWKESVLPVVTSTELCRTVLTVLLVATLGNLVMHCVNWILNSSLEDEDKDSRLKKYIKE